MDLNEISLVISEPIEFRLEHPITGNTLDGESDPVFYLMSPDSKKVRSLEMEQRNKLFKRVKNQGQITAEYQQSNEHTLLAACIAGWKNLTKDGQPFEYSPENALALMRDPELGIIQRQLMDFVNNEKNFMKKV